MTEYSAAILCGGRSTRMGQDKAQMQAGGMRMADRLLAAFSGCGEVLVSVRDEEQMRSVLETADKNAGAAGMADSQADQIRYVTDPVTGAGPLAGIVASLRVCRKDLLFAAAVDMPFMDRAFAEELLYLGSVSNEEQRQKQDAADGQEAVCFLDVLIPVGPDGRLHPLSAFYHKRCLPHLEKCLADGRYSLRQCLTDLRVKKIPVSQLTEGDRKLLNLNRPEDVQSVLFMRNQ